MAHDVGKLRYVMAGLILLTLVLLGWQHWGMNRRLEISPQTGYRYSVTDDRPEGDSIAQFIPSAQGGRLECSVGAKAGSPYCQLDIRTDSLAHGVDLSDYDSVYIEASYHGPGSHRLRLFLRNFDLSQSRAEDENSWKLNELDVTPNPANDHDALTIRLNNLNVNSAWLADNRIPADRSAVDLSNVVMLQIATPGMREPGLHRIDITALAFCGKWISREALLLVIVALWAGAAMIYLLLGLHRVRQNLAASRARQQELEAMNISLEIQNLRIEEAARRDPLTGARNRAGIRDELVREMKKARKGVDTFSIVFIDLDHFKRINDERGHGVGDAVLKQLVRELGSQIRHSDYLVRWGGEEFMLICTNTPFDAATRLAEKLRLHIRAAEWPEALAVTASFGVTTYAAPEALSAALARADAALYEAKHNGRNRVVGHAP
ncbi:GGDEF domain-containing protein [Amantichitinum ursilacus]|uniref:diguanylate cyclase n=1 Tax=Amantichitinum ursilacus TaxID=857265 RepID=A0A0N1JTW6_9NEIS|nr:GGDEF domain-containing protein [Amantichitinum ursilacus]KPC55174.1 Response regulator PleD [Amantichitinum ursilacus]